MAQVTEVKDPQAVEVSPEPAPVRRIDKEQMKLLGGALARTFGRYSADRHQAEQKWLRNLRQYLGIYDPEIESSLGKGRSRAYPRLTRVKCISVVSRIMNLMFPGVEKNWNLEASPNADMKMEDVHEAVERMMQKLSAAGGEAPKLDDKMVQMAVNELAMDRAKHLEAWIDDQLQEIGGDQTLDYVSLNRQVLKSGVMFGVGLLHGPFVRTESFTQWTLGDDGKPMPKTNTSFKPMYEFLPIWDFYPDMSAKTFAQMDGYFLRKVMSRAQLRDLAKRPDYFKDVITSYLATNQTGNYKAMSYETLLRNMGIRENVSEQAAADAGGKYDVRVWHGPISGTYLQAAGISSIPQDKLGDDFMAEVWLIDDFVIKCEINSWRKIGIDVNMIHAFVFDEDDTSPVGNGLPSIMRDSQMALCAATRMMLDNASVICGPNLEVNTDLLRPDQDLTAIEGYKIWYREGTGQEAQFPAVRGVQIDGHLTELLSTIELFQKFADAETFVGPQTGGDMDRQKSSEPMRSPVGASMLRSDAALPFKDIVRSFDIFTMSVIYSIVQFNRKFNPQVAPEGDYNVVARGATAMIAKEIRAMQLDQLAVTLTDEEKLEVDPRKLARARFIVRDLEDVLLPDTQAEANRRSREASQAELVAQQKEQVAAEVRKTLSDAFKNIAQGQKNTATADAATVKSVLELLERGLEDAASNNIAGSSAGTGGQPAQAAQQ